MLEVSEKEEGVVTLHLFLYRNHDVINIIRKLAGQIYNYPRKGNTILLISETEVKINNWTYLQDDNNCRDVEEEIKKVK